ncbi:recombinase family protein [Rothia kristinae]|uniref:recombinase family protein n=1 Tax=Rothia kristinae TaxID=37923 RepID=UPI0022E86B1D|nr:recombinase family protein [Rothia kristinae]
MAVLGYARVSTADQHLEGQRAELIDAGCEEVFADVVSGAQQSRPGLDALLERLEPGDVVTVVRLDRLGRSMMHTLTLIARFRDDGVGFRSLRDGIDADTAAGRLMIGLLASIAEYERELIRERTTAGLRAARAAGRRGGRPRAMTPERVDQLRRMLERGLTPPEIGKLLGVSRSTAYEYVRQVRALDDTSGGDQLETSRGS